MRIVLKITKTQTLVKACDVVVGDVLKIGGGNHVVAGVEKAPVIERQDLGQETYLWATVIRYEIRTEAMTIKAKADTEFLVERDTCLKPFREMKIGELFQKENEPCVKVSAGAYVNLLRTEYRILDDPMESFFVHKIVA